MHTRRSIVQNVLEKMERRGVMFDSDPRLHAWLEDWADGRIEMSDLRQRYQDLLRERQLSRQQSEMHANEGPVQASAAVEYSSPEPEAPQPDLLPVVAPPLTKSSLRIGPATAAKVINLIADGNLVASLPAQPEVSDSAFPQEADKADEAPDLLGQFRHS